MNKLDLINLDSIIENLEKSEEEVRKIIVEQGMTIFHTKDYYQGELNAYEDILLMLKVYKQNKMKGSIKNGRKRRRNETNI